jgi:hypothetical protein
LDSWICSRCGKKHAGTPQRFAFDAPWPWYTTPKPQRELYCTLTPDHCILFDQDFFVRGCLEIPIIGNREPFVWGVWVSLTKEHFEQYRLHPNPVGGEESYFGWLCSRIQMYPDTLLLKTHAHRREGLQPFIELELTDHPLTVEQRTGITRERAREIAELYEHKWVHPKWDEKGHYGTAS